MQRQFSVTWYRYLESAYWVRGIDVDRNEDVITNKLLLLNSGRLKNGL